MPYLTSDALRQDPEGLAFLRSVLAKPEPAPQEKRAAERPLPLAVAAPVCEPPQAPVPHRTVEVAADAA